MSIPLERSLKLNQRYQRIGKKHVFVLIDYSLEAFMVELNFGEGFVAYCCETHPRLSRWSNYSCVPNNRPIFIRNG